MYDIKYMSNGPKSTTLILMYMHLYMTYIPLSCSENDLGEAQTFLKTVWLIFYPYNS